MGVLECAGASKPHVILFGKWTAAKWPNATGEKMFDLRVRPLLVDSRVKQYTTGNPHEVTDRVFVVRRVFRINDTLPSDGVARWQWQRRRMAVGGSAHGASLSEKFSAFDPFYSTTSWYRDYIVYSGVSDEGKKLYAMVVQVGRRKPILKKDVGEALGDPDPDSECPSPTWERKPLRVTFQPADDEKVVFALRNRVVDVVNDAEEEE
jgi:hypothetical protein